MNARSILALLVTAVAIAPAPAVLAANEGSIHVDVSTFRNKNGVLGCQLFAKEAGFPDTNSFGQVQAAIPGATASCAFTAVPPGTYAVSVVHDENRNGKLDTNFFGFPIEGYGVSNNKTYTFSAPKWSESRFELAAGQAKKISVTLRY